MCCRLARPLNLANRSTRYLDCQEAGRPRIPMRSNRCRFRLIADRRQASRLNRRISRCRRGRRSVGRYWRVRGLRWVLNRSRRESWFDWGRLQSYHLRRMRSRFRCNRRCPDRRRLNRPRRRYCRFRRWTKIHSYRYRRRGRFARGRRYPSRRRCGRRRRRPSFRKRFPTDRFAPGGRSPPPRAP